MRNIMQNSHTHDTSAIREYMHNARTHNIHKQIRTTKNIRSQHNTAQHSTTQQHKKHISQSQEKKLWKQKKQHITTQYNTSQHSTTHHNDKKKAQNSRVKLNASHHIASHTTTHTATQQAHRSHHARPPSFGPKHEKNIKVLQVFAYPGGASCRSIKNQKLAKPLDRTHLIGL